ncbi:MAG TPA: TIGR03943 family protein [Actinomycetota bacterium]|nr:TIGR03943 family protein [Actinomycetota bacterium]
MTTAEATLERAEERHWSAARLASAAAMAAWAALFWWLLATGRSFLYLSDRTDWVVPMGAIILTVAVAGRLWSARGPRPEPLKRSDAWRLGGIVLPVVLTVALPPASLGSYAAGRRSSFVSSGYTSTAADIESGQLSLVDVAGALRSREAMQALVNRAGQEVSFVGFVARDSGMPADEFMLSRFLVSCCVADALSIQVRVVGAPPGELAEDDWVRVTGAFYPLGREVIVDASEVEPVPRPKRPYLNP